VYGTILGLSGRALLRRLMPEPGTRERTLNDQGS
jgi:hypothetical protein